MQQDWQPWRRRHYRRIELQQKTLQSIIVARNLLGTSGGAESVAQAESLAEALKINKVLKSLDLSDDSSIGSKGAVGPCRGVENQQDTNSPWQK
jgi:DUF917 family protein